MLRKNFVKFVKSSNRKTNTNFRRFYDFKAFSNPFIKSASFNAFSTTTEPNKIAQKKPEKKAIQINEKIKGKRSEEKFKAETKEILEIVSKSIYTNKEIFLRELISNSSDAIEQLRYKMRESPNDFSQNVDFKINIFTDPQNNRIIIQDNGIGMAKKQLTENLGIIAKSGSKNFMKSIKNKGDKASTIIGQFGVGFYSSFMISSKVEVFTKSWLDKSSSAFYWVSDGKGTFSISEAENVKNGTKIIINLDENCSDFSKRENIEKIIKQYSNFIEFPIFLDGKKMNMEGALWLKDPKSVSEIRHSEFYKNMTNAYDSPMLHIHFRKDYPIALNSILYIPKYHSEKYGNARMKPGVSLYSKKVLIQKNSTELLPDWMRFVKGVADSEDLNLNISRDSTQSKSTLSRIGSILTKTLIARLKETIKNDPTKYEQFYEEYALFLKEGVCTDSENKDALAPLLKFDSSKIDNKSKKKLEDKNDDLKSSESSKEKISSLKEKISGRTFDDYVGAMDGQQTKIYYLVTSNRSAAENSPYFESFKKKGREVLFLYTPIDEFVMQGLGSYKNRKLVSIESAKLDEEDMDQFDSKKKEFELSEDQSEDLCEWLQNTLKSKVKTVKITRRLDKAPAIVTGHESASVQVMMNLASGGADNHRTPQTLNINPAHPVVRGLFYTMKEEEPLAKKVAEQMLDNAMIAAGLIKDPREMLARLGEIMTAAMDVEGIEMELKEKKANKKK